MVAARIAVAWERQRDRQQTPNAELGPAALDRGHGFARPAVRALCSLSKALRLSPRRIHRAAWMARTIADLAEDDVVVTSTSRRPCGIGHR